MSIKSNYIEYLLDGMNEFEMRTLARETLVNELSSQTDHQLKKMIEIQHGVELLHSFTTNDQH